LELGHLPGNNKIGSSAWPCSWELGVWFDNFTFVWISLISSRHPWSHFTAHEGHYLIWFLSLILFWMYSIWIFLFKWQDWPEGICALGHWYFEEALGASIDIRTHHVVCETQPHFLNPLLLVNCSFIQLPFALLLLMKASSLQIKASAF